jgi:HD-GYP domain-containing protein (c-di-GMP phosphodiesterase class II)
MTLGADAENFEMAGHAEEGERIVAGAKFSPEIASAVRHHHERWDGQGKPDGIGGADIPLAARILAVAESYEAMTAGRGCERLTVAAALERLKAGSGSEFDPDILEALTKAVGDGTVESLLPAVALPAVAAPVPA